MTANETPKYAGVHSTHWERVFRRLRAEVGDDIYSCWFARMEFEGVANEIARISLPTRFLRNWNQTHYGERLLALWRDELPEVKKVDLVVRSALTGHTNGAPKQAVVTATAGRDAEARRGRLPPSDGRGGGSPLDPRLNFSTFLVGRSNALAHAAALQVAESAPDTQPRYNPLYIVGGIGLGKTHLLQAVAWAVEARGRRALYLTAERFMQGFASALRSQSATSYKEALRGIDLLATDDLQFLHGKQMQQEFGHTLNALIDAGRQVVVAADRPPSELEALDERARSRLAGGLAVEIGPLEEELRVRVLEAHFAALKADNPGFEVPPAVIARVARQITHNGRDLDGAVNRLLAHNQLSGRPVTIEMADEVIRDLVRPADPRRIRVEDILRVVSKHYGVSRADILSSRRTANVVLPRQVAMYLAKTLTLRSLPDIGGRFGGRDHTTVLHAVRKIEGLLQSDKALAETIELLKRLLNE
jgi:chromosomal replication initiator protein